nr:MAG TPA: hypothetical protein [Caudoviricetes sp.]
MIKLLPKAYFVTYLLPVCYLYKSSITLYISYFYKF